MTSRTGSVRPEPAEQVEQALEDPDLQPVRLRAARRVTIRPVGGHGRELRDEAGQDRQSRPGGRRDRVGIDVPGQCPQHLDDRSEGESVVAESDRSALEDEPAILAQLGGRLGHEPALADARLAADEHDGRLTGLGRSRGRDERRELFGSTDEHRAGQAAGHALDDRR